MPYIKNLYTLKKFILLLSLAFFCFAYKATAQTTTVGSGSYTNTYPGADEAGRNGFPSGTPQLSGNAVGKPVPTNDWWSKLLKENHADNLFNYPMTLKTINRGLIVTYIPFGVIGDSAPIEVGLAGLNASKTTVADYTDWTVTMNWNDGSHDMTVTSGIGMPFLYFEKETDDVLQIKVNGGTASISGELLIVENAASGADFVFYAPAGSSWSNSGSTYTSTLSGKNYWSMAMLPQDNSGVTAVANEYKKYAYVFPDNTTTTWSFDEATSVVKTDFVATTVIKEGTNTNLLMGLLPHQWDNLAANSPQPDKYSYSSIRGQLKTMEGNTFSVENTFKGILPTMPYLANSSPGFSPSALASKIDQIKNDGLSTWTDSYNEGQVMNRLIQTARIADQTGDIEARDKMVATIKERLEDWLSYEAGEVAFLFYYNTNWSALLGYPAGHGQDNNINDHHFHWGYFIHAAAFMEQFEPGWKDSWGEMVNHLVRDAATDNRSDEKFPFMRNFSPYAGHCWANGFATFPQGNDQESTSESMQFNSSLIHWGTVTGNDQIRDLGIYLYTTEQTAIEEYWLDIHERNFRDNQQYSLVSRVWGNSYDNGTFWTADITASYGIELYPMHGGSLYLGHHLDYVTKLWAEIEKNTAILSPGDTNPNLWHDTFWKLLSFIDPAKAIELYDADPDRIMKFGITDVQTYHWLHAMNVMGTLRADITADYPIAVAFEKDGSMTYVAHNYSESDITVTYSDGFELSVPAGKMATNRDASVTGVITADFKQAYTNGSVNVTVNPSGAGVTKVVFFDGNNEIGELTEAPFTMKVSNLTLGIHGLYAKIYAGDNFNVTNIIQVQVGEQVPYSGVPTALPGVLEAGHYDKFEGGKGQGISYVDVSTNNEGEFRPDEMVDATVVNNEGATIGWISSGEWVEYTVNIEITGLYKMDFRYASGNASGGGPFHLEINGKKISDDIRVTSTSADNWDTWTTKTVTGLPFPKGKHVLKLAFTSGEFNLGKMTFTRTGDLNYTPPFADAGANVVVLLPDTKANLDGSSSTVENGKTLTYSWSQIYGPSAINFSDITSATLEASNLEEGVYKCLLTVNDGTHTSQDELLIILSTTANTAPTVSITAPSQNKTFKQGEVINIEVSAADLDGTISKVEFYNGTTLLGESISAPFTYSWRNAPIGDHVLKAKTIDNGGAEAVSQEVSISVDQVRACTQTSNESQQGSFSRGYISTFETVGNSVSITFELLDTDRQGVVAYLWKQSPFGEVQMDNVKGNTFSKSVSGVTDGQTISYACKFAFAGGLAVTKYISYVVGSSCNETKSTDVSLSDLLVDGSTIDGFTSNTLTYSLELNSGTTLVPTVSATATDSKATVEVTPAGSLPGTTTVEITAEDGVTMSTYTIDFTVRALRTDASLSDLQVDGETINGFSSTQLTYNFELSAGTTIVPTVSGTTTDTMATLVVTPTTNLPGSTSVVVTAEDGVTKTTYTIVFTLGAEDANASLSDLQVDGTTIIGFSPNKLNYTLELSAGTTSVPIVHAITSSATATVAVTPATSLPGTTSVEVTAQDGTTKTTYTIAFTVEVLNTDASLSDLQVDGLTVTGFSSSKLTYNMELTSGTTLVPVVSATTTDPNATVAVTPATSLPGIAFVVVTAQDGIIKATYAIAFTVKDPSNDAILSDLKVDGATITSFSPYQLTYSMELNPGTTTVPTVSATPSSATAAASVTPATSLPGTTTIMVTAEDGTTKVTYTIAFTVEVLNDDASLSDLKVDGTSITGFASDKLTYSMELNPGTTSVPTVSAITTDSKATVAVTPASSLPGTTSVVVTAEDGTTKVTYTIAFTVEVLNDDASLSDLKVDGTTINGFASDKANYSMELAEGTQTIPTVTAFTKDPKAKATIVPASGLPGNTSVQVISEDGKTSATYTIDFTVAEVITLRSVSMGLKVFSNGNDLYIRHSDANFKGSFEVFNLSGKRLLRGGIHQLDNQFLLSEGGVLFFRVYDEQGIVLAGKVLMD